MVGVGWGQKSTRGRWFQLSRDNIPEIFPRTKVNLGGGIHRGAVLRWRQLVSSCLHRSGAAAETLPHSEAGVDGSALLTLSTSLSLPSPHGASIIADFSSLIVS